MKKILLTLILIFQIGILSAQKSQSELIIGTWRFEMECDLRTEKEKSEILEPKINPIEIETENGTGYADRTFKKNKEFEFYYNSNHTDYGKYEVKDQKLIIENRLSNEQAESKPNVVEWLLKRKLLEKKEDGFYYSRPLALFIKSIDQNQIEFGTEKHYTIWRRIK